MHTLSRIVRHATLTCGALTALVWQKSCAYETDRSQQSAHRRTSFGLATLLPNQTTNERENQHADQTGQNQYDCANIGTVIHIFSWVRSSGLNSNERCVGRPIHFHEIDS